MPEYRQRISERFGFCPHLKDTLWVHAVSVGESLAAIPLIKALKNAYPTMPILVTNMTATGAARVKAVLGDNVIQAYIPYDLPDAVHRFLSRIQPKIAVILETELWPNLFAACKSRQVPLIVTNARLSEKSAKGYQSIATITREMLSAISVLASQGKADAERFVSLGLPSEKVSVTGNLKYDLEIPADLIVKGQALREQLGKDRPIWIAASTHGSEEEIILAAHRLIREKIPHALLVLVPRHPDRFAQVAALIEQQGFTIARRSQAMPCTTDTQVYFGDTMGEMLTMYSAIDVAFVAGSFAQVGGHNVLEPAALSKPIISGPVLFNFTEISQKLIEAKGLTIVKNAEELAATVSELFADPNKCKQQGDNARRVVDENRGALQKQFHLVQSLLSSGG
jgi:3-deoxy-D-manno-octulosonic-acid transferase